MNKIAFSSYSEQLEKIRKNIKEKLLPLLEVKDKEILLKLEKDLEETVQRDYLTIAFIGEYSAGKTTLISALTGRRDLKISADIATNECCEYEWNGVRLIDTPGLGTERQDHDERTYDTIKKADLLVYCLTYSLFDTLTLKNFKKLAFERNYQKKMMLLVNKMSAEAGDVNERISSYTESLKKSLEPESLDIFPLVFCDARDQLEGEDEQDEELKAESRFNTLIKELNHFVKENNIRVRLQTLLDMIEECLETVIENLLDDKEAKEQGVLIDKYQKIVKESKNKLNSEVRKKISNFAENNEKKIQDLMSNIDEVMTQKNQEDVLKRWMDGLRRDIEGSISKLCEELQKDFEEAYSSLEKGIEYQTNLTKDFEDRFYSKGKSFDDVDFSTVDTDAMDFNKSLKNFAKGLENTQAIIKLLETSGVLSKISKVFDTIPYINIVTGICSIFAANVADKKEQDIGDKIRKAKKDMREALYGQVKECEKRVEEITNEVSKQFYEPVENKILEMRKSYEEKINSCNKAKHQAIALCEACEALSKEI